MESRKPKSKKVICSLCPFHRCNGFSISWSKPFSNTHYMMMEYSTLNLSKWYSCRIRIPSDKIITFNILASFEHRLLHFSLFTKYLVHFFCLRYRPKWNYVYIVHLFDKINPLIKLDEGTRLVYRAQAVHRINLFLF